MNQSDSLTTLFSHHLWANERLFAQCADLTDDQLDATVDGTYGSICDTLRHIVRAEQSYFARISTGQPYVWPENEPPLTPAAMMAALQTTGRGLIDWAPKIQADDTVDIDWNGVMRPVPKTILLTQVINHATEHRAQVMTILTQLGIEPPELSGWAYFDNAML